MSSLVSQKPAGGYELFVALITRIGFLAAVDPSMRGETIRSSKRCGTLRAEERSLTAMNPLVLFESVGGSESSLAFVATE